ncbi:unnamed protein product, partial [Didymodactylos carnosus]
NRYSKADRTPPFALAALIHKELIKIHPFSDGNGRTTRVVVSNYLISKEYLPLLVTLNDRDRYIEAVQAAVVDDNLQPFIVYLYEQQLAALKFSESESMCDFP